MKLESSYSIYVFLILLLYILVPAPLKLLLLSILLVIICKKPEVASIILIATPIFDQYYIIPYYGRSILLVIFPFAILSLIYSRKFKKSINHLLPILFIFSFLMLYSTIAGFNSLSSYSGFNDPSRGIVFLISIIFISILLYSVNSTQILLNIRKMLWIIPYLFLISVPLSMILYIDYFEQSRFQGTFGDPNYFARYAILSLLISIFFLNNGLKKYFIITIITIFIIFSASKTAVIVLLLCLCYYIFKENNGYKTYLLSIIFIGAIIFSLIEIPDLIITRFTEVPSSIWFHGVKLTNPLDIITSGRTFIWKFFIEEFDLNNPIFFLGSGIGTSSSFFIPLLGETIVAHNSFLEVLIDIGLFGFILLFFVLFKVQKISSKIGLFISSSYPYFIIIFLFYNSTLSGFWVKQNIAIIFLIIITYGRALRT